LNGFGSLELIESGYDNLNDILSNPSGYTLSHIGADIDAWGTEDRTVFSFDGGCHFIFTPVKYSVRNSLRYNGLQWV
jgi:hypothetical protein